MKKYIVDFFRLFVPELGELSWMEIIIIFVIIAIIVIFALLII